MSIADTLNSKIWEKIETFLVALGLVLIAAGLSLPFIVYSHVNSFLEIGTVPWGLQEIGLNQQLAFQLDLFLCFWPLISILIFFIGWRISARGLRKWSASSEEVVKEVDQNPISNLERIRNRASQNPDTKNIPTAEKPSKVKKNGPEKDSALLSAVRVLGASVSGTHIVRTETKFKDAVFDLLAISKNKNGAADIIVEFKIIKSGFSSNWVNEALQVVDLYMTMYRESTARKVQGFLIVLLDPKIPAWKMQKLHALALSQQKYHSANAYITTLAAVEKFKFQNLVEQNKNVFGSR